MSAVFSSYAYRKAMKRSDEAFEYKLYVLRQSHEVYPLCVVNGETSIPSLNGVFRTEPNKINSKKLRK